MKICLETIISRAPCISLLFKGVMPNIDSASKIGMASGLVNPKLAKQEISVHELPEKTRKEH